MVMHRIHPDELLPWVNDYTFMKINLIKNNYILRCHCCNEIIDLKEDYIVGNKGFVYCSENCMESALSKTKFGTNEKLDSHYWGYNWVEKYVFTRDNYTCQICNNRFDNKYNSVSDPKKNGLTLHHKTALCNGGTTTPSNLVTFCKECHEEYEHQLQVIKNIPMEYLVCLIA